MLWSSKIFFYVIKEIKWAVFGQFEEEQTVFVSLGISLWLYIIHNGIFLFTGIMALILFVILLIALYRSLFLKNWIGENGIYHQSTPGDGQYYRYEEIKSAKDNSGDTLSSGTFYSCTLRLVDSSEINIPFTSNDWYGIEYLLHRINGEEDGRKET